MAVVAGIDVGKLNLDASVSEGPVIRFDNTAAGLTRLLKHLRALDVATAVCESTGGYERLLVNRLRETEIAVYVAHPNRVRAFARACGYEAKTDPRDAQVLSRYGQVFPDAETPGRELEPEREEL
jgi:transposase